MSAETLEPVPQYPEHQDLSYYLDGEGNRHPIQSRADWDIRKRHILAHMQTVMGPLPAPEKKVPLNLQMLDEESVGRLTRRKIAYHTDSPDRVVSAYLFLPPTSQKVPAILCLHQTTGIGK